MTDTAPGLFPRLARRLGRAVGAAEALLRWLLAYPLLTGQFLLLFLIAWAGLGKELGAELLFWHEQWPAQLGTGATVGMLTGVLLFLNYLLYRPEWLTGPAEPEPAAPPPWVDRLPGTLFPSAVTEVRRVGTYLLWGMLAVLALFVVPKLVAAVHYNGSNGGAWEYLMTRTLCLPFVAGYILSVGFARLLFLLDERWCPCSSGSAREWLLVRRAVPVWGADGGLVRVTVREYLKTLTEPPAAAVVPLHGIAMYLMLVALVVLAGLLGLVAAIDGASPGTALTSPVSLVCVGLIVFSMVYGLLAFHLHLQRLVFGGTVLCLLVWNSTAVFRGQNEYKLQFPGLDGCGPVLTLWEPGDSEDGGALKTALADTEPYARAHLVDSERALEAMAERWRKEQKRGPREKPRVLIICTSGGGIRAAVWTGVVLRHLDEIDGETRTDAPPDRLRDHIRLFTGASGGMVGATLYVADFEHGSNGRPMFTDDHVEALAADSLTRTAQSLVLRDMLWNTAFVPPWGHAEFDRGRTLEQMWGLNAEAVAGLGVKGRLHPNGRSNPWGRTFAQLRVDERIGGRPSVIYSPLMVEDARRLLISNLNLTGVNPADDLSLGVGPRGPGARSAVEFHRLFPDVPAGPNDPWAGRRTSERFPVVTAARMNATFPVISPAVSLPTNPPRRVVDAGIYDNYGVNVAAAWMLKHESALRRHTSGVALVQVRAFPLHDARLTFAEYDPQTGKEARDPSRGDLLSDTLAAASAPTEALLAARSNAAYFRNAEQVEVLHRRFNGGGALNFRDRKKPRAELARDPDLRDQFFTTVWFELRRPAALNWYLTEGEKRYIKGGWSDDLVQQELNWLKAWYGTGGRATP